MKPTPELINDWHEKARQMAIQADGYFDDVEHWRHFAELAAAWGAKQAQQTTDPLGFQIRRAIAAEDELRATKQTLEHAYAALQKVADAQAAIEEPELPEAVAWVKGLPEGTTHYSAGTPFNECGSAFDVVVRAFKYDDGGLLVYRTDNDGEYGGWAKAESLFKVVPDTHHLHAFTATQMHDHFAAGVRAGMAQSQWQPIDSAPKDEIVMVAVEFDCAGDWRIKVGYEDSENGCWKVWGASWTPTHWMPLPTPPKEQQ